MNPYLLRDAVASALASVVPPGVNYYTEPPDALVPPAYCVRWDSTSPGSGSGLLEHSITIEVWPSTDLTAEPHWDTRDQLALVAMQLAESLRLEGAGIADWRADADVTRQLGQQTVRISTVTLAITEPSLC